MDIVFSDSVFAGGPNDGYGFFDINHTSGPVSLDSLLRHRIVVLASSMTAQRECLERAGLYDESLRMSEDFDLLLRLAAAGANLITTAKYWSGIGIVPACRATNR